MSRFYLGVDGGQSSTTALIADASGEIIGRGRGGPCNHVSGQEAVVKFHRVIGDCLSEACSEAGLDAAGVRFAAACLGFSGGPEDKRELVMQLIRSARYLITHDAEIALAGATAGEPGIIVIAGTGSMAFGRNAHRQTARAGGWGYIFGDEGGAFDIVRQALRAALRAEEGWGPGTDLLSRLLSATKTESANALLHAFYTPDFPRSRVASLAPLVDHAAQAGDDVAAYVLQQAASELAELVRGVHVQLFSVGTRVPVVPVGGAFGSAILTASLARELASTLGCRLTEARWNPATGAVLEALRLDHNPNLPYGTGLSGK